MPTYETGQREYRRHKTDEVVLAFASAGVAINTIAYALVVPRERVKAICERAIEHGDLQRLPPLAPVDARTAAMTELVHLREKLLDAQQLIRDMTARADDIGEKLWARFRLTWSEAQVLTRLITGEACSKTRLYYDLYGATNPDEAPEPKIVDVFVCKMRRKLKPHDIHIETLWGSGYRMTPDNVAKVRALLLPTVESPPLTASAADVVAA